MTSDRRRTVIFGGLLGLGALITSFPFIWMVTTSLKPLGESRAYPPTIVPTTISFDSYVRLFTELDFARYLLNTVIVVAIGFGGMLLVAMAGYGFAKFRFPGRNAMFLLVLATMMIPVQVTMIPTYLILNSVGLTNTLLGVALPMSRPILAVLGVLTFITGWNSFLWPLVIATDSDNYTLSVGLSLLNKQLTVSPPLQMAGASLMVIPILVVFVILQRHIVQGFALSGLK